MVLSDEHIREFQALYLEHFGKEISVDEAREDGAKLVRLISILYRPTEQNETEPSAPHAELLTKQK
jgi:hypothetical protein